MESRCCKKEASAEPCREKDEKPSKKPCKKAGKKGEQEIMQIKDKAAKIAETAIMFMCPDWDSFSQDILQECIIQMLKLEEKAQRKPDSEFGGKGAVCPCGGKAKCEDEHDPETRMKTMCKQYIENSKDKIKERMNIAMGGYRKIFGPFPPKFEKHRMPFVKSISRILRKMNECSECTKECLDKIAKDYWAKKSKKIFCGMKNKAHKFAEDALLCICDSNPPHPLCKDAEAYVLGKALALRWSMCLMSRPKASEEEKNEGDIGKKPKKSKKTVAHKKMKKAMKEEFAAWAIEFIGKNGENIKVSALLMKETLDTVIKDCPKFPESRKKETILKMAAKCLELATGEKKDKEEFAAKYVKAMFVPCPKDCIERCENLFKLALRLNGVKDSNILNIGSKLGAHMCCQTNGKSGCSEDLVAEYASKWIKEHLGMVEEAVRAAQELSKECKEFSGSTYMKERCSMKALIWWLKWNCGEATFSKDEYKKYWAEQLEIMRKCKE